MVLMDIHILVVVAAVAVEGEVWQQEDEGEQHRLQVAVGIEMEPLQRVVVEKGVHLVGGHQEDVADLHIETEIY